MLYKGYEIEEDTLFVGRGYTVRFCGDEVWFETVTEAMKFIDELISQGEVRE